LLEDDDEGWVESEEAGPELGTAESLADADGENSLEGPVDGSEI
jgi:hypothetical protein